MIRILVADDHTVMREGVKKILDNKSDMVVDGEAADGKETLEKALSGRFDLVLLDISMPGRGGLEVLEDILKARPRLPVLILSMHPEEQYAVRALRAGASGYLTKASAAHELIGAIRKVSRGGKYVTTSLAEAGGGPWTARPRRRSTRSSPPASTRSCSCSQSGKSVGRDRSELCLSVKDREHLPHPRDEQDGHEKERRAHLLCHEPPPP